MNKDVIYIDVEDDITAIIGKVKDSKEKIVALVPPKRVGVLQSAVNLHLLSRTATQNGKHLVLISSNSALIALASAAKIPVAKNLQSKPELAEIPALDVDDGEDIIDGAQLPVGELARTADQKVSGSSAIDDALKENAAEEPLRARAIPPAPGQSPAKPRTKSGVKVPNFNTFRKKIVLIGAGIVLLIAFLVWAIFFAPRATVVISARTTDASANAKVTLSPTAPTSLATSTLKTVSKQQKQEAALEFDATGTKDVGEKAKGQIVFRNCETQEAQTIPAGTTITANGRTYATTAAATVPGGSGGFGGCAAPGVSSAVGIEAKDIGEDFNTPNGTTFTVAGHSNSSPVLYFRAAASTDITGGTKRQVKVVTAEDVQKATDQLAQQNGEDIKKQLKGQFAGEEIVLDQSFKIDRSLVKPSPAVGEEAPGAKGKLTGSITYSLMGAKKSEIGRYLDDYFAKQLEGKNDQRIYDNGVGKVTFTDVLEAEGVYTANIVANAKVGPKIDDAAIKSAAKGKRYGDIQSNIETISGVDDVDIKFWPFWVNTTPNDDKRITVEFKLNESK